MSICIAHNALSPGDLKACGADYRALVFPDAARGRAATAWLSSSPSWASDLDAHAACFARMFSVKADRPTAINATSYGAGAESPEHQDQLVAGRTWERDRTVTAILMLEPADSGGEMRLQDPKRAGPRHTVDLRRNDLLLFPADFWHEVLPVRAGVRRTLIRWYRDSTGAAFYSDRRGGTKDG